MTAEEIKQLPVREKMQMMEAIWEDFRERLEEFEIPETHKRLLDQRRKNVENGTATLLDWDEAKDTIGRS